MEQWHRQQGESAPAYEARWKYIQMGPGRSLSAVAQELSKSDTLIKRWSARWRWVESAEGYDRHMAALEQQRIEEEAGRLADEKAEQWAARLDQLREEEWKVAQEVLKRVQTMLKWPLEKKKVVSGEDGAVTIIEPVLWRASDISKLLLTYSKLARLAAGAETDRDFDFDSLTDEQLAKLARTGRL